MPFRELVQADAELRKLREEYAAQPAKQRRMAAQWAYDSIEGCEIIVLQFKWSETHQLDAETVTWD